MTVGLTRGLRRLVTTKPEARRAVRVGVDLVDVPIFRRRFDGRPELVDHVFSADEVAYCLARRSPWPHFAARFAAKEAVLKAMGTGLAGAMAWRDVEVVRDPAGTPRLAFHGAIIDALNRQGLGVGALSLSHTEARAIAVVLLFPR